MVKLYSRQSSKGKKLYVEYQEEGKRVRKSLNLLDTKANVAYAHRNIIPQIERNLDRGIVDREYMLSEFTDMVLSEAKRDKKYDTYLVYRSCVNEFFKICKDKDVNNYRVRDIDDYISKLRETRASGTVKLYLIPIRLAFNEAIRTEVLDKNPVTYAKKPPVKHKKKKPFTLLQMKRLLDEAEGELKTFLHIAFYTGARPSEVLALRGRNILKDKILIEFSLTRRREDVVPKSGNMRKIPLLEPLKTYLDSIEIKHSERILSLSHWAMRKRFKELLEKVGYEKTTLHNTRHTFTSLLMKANENPTLIQHFLGHSDLTMINRVYAHYIEDENDADRINLMFNSM